MRTRSALLSVVLVFTLAAACGGGEGDATPTSAVSSSTAATGAEDAGFRLLSPAFEEGDAIPERFAPSGDNVSPPLVWRFPPRDHVEYLVVVDDPDSPSGDFTHWLVAGIPAAALNLPEGELPEGAVEGTNDVGRVGWSGPGPPPGEVHTYRFTVHALGAASELERGFDRDDLETALEGKVLASATLTARYPGD